MVVKREGKGQKFSFDIRNSFQSVTMVRERDKTLVMLPMNDFQLLFVSLLLKAPAYLAIRGFAIRGLKNRQ
jgi:hypothetical protein